MKTKKMKFPKWWKTIKNKSKEEQTEIFSNWLRFACKTVSLRGDANEQALVYTVSNRFHKSTWKHLSKANAQKVFRIVNNKQGAHKRAMAEIKELKQQVKRLMAQPSDVQPRSPNERVVVTTKKVRRIVSSGGHGHVTGRISD